MFEVLSCGRGVSINIAITAFFFFFFLFLFLFFKKENIRKSLSNGFLN